MKSSHIRPTSASKPALSAASAARAAPVTPAAPASTAAPPLLPLRLPGSAGTGAGPTGSAGFPGGPSDALNPQVKLPLGIGPRVFGPLPNDPKADEQRRSVLPGVGGSF